MWESDTCSSDGGGGKKYEGGGSSIQALIPYKKEKKVREILSRGEVQKTFHGGRVLRKGRRQQPKIRERKEWEKETNCADRERGHQVASPKKEYLPPQRPWEKKSPLPPASTKRGK